MISWTSFKNSITIKTRIENESFAGDAFMRHPIFLYLYIFQSLTMKSKDMLN